MILSGRVVKHVHNNVVYIIISIKNVRHSLTFYREYDISHIMTYVTDPMEFEMLRLILSSWLEQKQTGTRNDIKHLRLFLIIPVSWLPNSGVSNWLKRTAISLMKPNAKSKAEALLKVKESKVWSVKDMILSQITDWLH